MPAGKGVKLKFEDLDLAKSYDICDQQSTNEKDYVKIGNGKDPQSNEFALYCGYQYFSSGSYPEIQATGRDIWIKFYSNSLQSWGVSDKGFKVHFEAVDICKYHSLLFVTVMMRLITFALST